MNEWKNGWMSEWTLCFTWRLQELFTNFLANIQHMGRQRRHCQWAADVVKGQRENWKYWHLYEKITPVQVTHIYFSEPSFLKQCSPKYQRSKYAENWVLLLLGLDWSKHFLPEVSAENLLWETSQQKRKAKVQIPERNINNRDQKAKKE